TQNWYALIGREKTEQVVIRRCNRLVRFVHDYHHSPAAEREEFRLLRKAVLIQQLQPANQESFPNCFKITPVRPEMPKHAHWPVADDRPRPLELLGRLLAQFLCVGKPDDDLV